VRARPQVRDGLIAFKIKRWKTIAHNPSALEEHTRLAEESLRGQRNGIAARERRV